MADPASLISNAFQVFLRDAPDHARAWGAMVSGLAQASALEKKTAALAYLAVLAARGLGSGIPFHVQAARQAGASRDEVIGAILIGLPAAGLGVIQALPSAIAAYGAPGGSQTRQPGGKKQRTAVRARSGGNTARPRGTGRP